jgi:tetratricopeptide (TPR) repeat protein
MNVNLLVRLIGLASLLSVVISTATSGATLSTDGQRITVDPKVENLLKQASSALNGKQYDLVISRLTAALQMKPEKNTASAIYAWRADAYIHKGELNKAMNDANESIRLTPHFYGGYLERGIVYRRTGNLDKAISDYETAIRFNANSSLAYQGRAVAYDYKGDYQQSIRDSTEAIRRNPRGADLYVSRAVGNVSIGSFDKAIADYAEAIRLNPTDVAAYSGRGYVNLQAGNLNRASADYDQATRCIPKGAYGYMFRGRAYFAKGNYKAAASDFENAAQLSRNNDQVLNSLSWFKATCLDSSFRNGKQAVQEAIKACELTKWKDPSCLDTLAAAYAETGDFYQARKYQTQALNMTGVYAFWRKKRQERLELYTQHKPYREESKLTKR